MLGIIGAMDVEVAAIKALVVGKKTTKLAGVDFVCGTIDGVDVCVAQCSPGKVNAAVCTQAMIDNFKVDCVINTGVGCSLADNVVIKDVVVATDVCQYDIDITALGEARGLINGINLIKVPCDTALSNNIAQIAAKNYNVHRGGVASGDTFIASANTKQFIHNEFGSLCGEMEGGAIGHTCYVNNIPFAILRTISDGGDEKSQIDYPSFKPIAADIGTKIIFAYIKSKK